MPVLMIGSAGALLGPVAAAALARGGATVIRGYGDDDPPLRSRYYAGFLRHPPLHRKEAFQAFLLDHAKADGETVLLPVSDPALLALQPIRRELDALAPVAAAPADATAVALDKARTVEEAARLEDALFPPRTILPADAAEAVTSWTGPYPVVVKPRTGTGTEGIRLARDPEELRATFSLVARSYDRPLVQTAIRFRVERKFHLYYLFDHWGRLRSWYGQRHLVERRSMGLGAGNEKVPGGVALLWDSWLDEELLSRGRRFMEAIGWRGLGFIEGAFDERDGRPYIFEINARMGGTQALSLREGVNLVHDACLVALRRIPPERLRFRSGARAKRDPFTLLGTRDPSLILRILDPRWVGSIPRITDPRPVVEAALRIALWKGRG